MIIRNKEDKIARLEQNYKSTERRYEEDKIENDKKLLKRLEEFEFTINDLKSHNKLIKMELKVANESDYSAMIRKLKEDLHRAKKDLVAMNKEKNSTYERLLEENEKVKNL